MRTWTCNLIEHILKCLQKNNLYNLLPKMPIQYISSRVNNLFSPNMSLKNVFFYCFLLNNKNGSNFNNLTS